MINEKKENIRMNKMNKRLFKTSRYFFSKTAPQNNA